jgi:hypothetical protein
MKIQYRSSQSSVRVHARARAASRNGREKKEGRRRRWWWWRRRKVVQSNSYE